MMVSHLGFMSQIPSLLMDIIIGSVTSPGYSNNGRFKDIESQQYGVSHSKIF